MQRIEERGFSPEIESRPKILNLTQHAPTPDQRSSGVADMSLETGKNVRDLMTFDELPTVKEMQDRAKKMLNLPKQSVQRMS